MNNQNDIVISIDNHERSDAINDDCPPMYCKKHSRMEYGPGSGVESQAHRPYNPYTKSWLVKQALTMFLLPLCDITAEHKRHALTHYVALSPKWKYVGTPKVAVMHDCIQCMPELVHAKQ